jgi:hypothetical protein
LRFNDRITRQAVWSSRGDGDYFQQEAGPFFSFVEEVITPLQEFLAGLGNKNSTQQLSPQYLVRLAASEPVRGLDSRPAHLSP